MNRKLVEGIPDASLYRDVRSTSRSTVLSAKQSAKYYGYRGVHPAWVGQPYLNIKPDRSETGYFYRGQHNAMYFADSTLIAPKHLEVRTWTKRDQYVEREDNIWPLDRRHSVGRKIREKRSERWRMSSLGRRPKQRSKALAGEIEDGQGVIDYTYFDYDDVDYIDDYYFEDDYFKEPQVDNLVDTAEDYAETVNTVSACLENWGETSQYNDILPGTLLDLFDEFGNIYDTESEFDKLSELDFDTVSVDWFDGEG